MGENNLPDYIQYLLRADSYPHPVDSLQLVQTHISFIILAGEYAYKWKKAVEFGFLDFSSMEKRKFYCEQELLLNRRLCPDVYLDVVSLSRHGDSFRLNDRGEIVEFGVKMMRLPEDKMMIPIMEKGLLKRRDIDHIVGKLVPFYNAAECSERVEKYGSVAAVGKNVLENLRQVEPFIETTLLGRRQFENIRDFSLSFLERKDLFSQRVEAGKIRDCHGDLHAGNICLADDVFIFDCIEFSDRLRCGDVAADVAFLAMDLDLHGFEQMSDYFIEQYVDASGDSDILSMLAFYKCYRACVRGKINLLTSLSLTLDASGVKKCRVQAKKCFDQAQRYQQISL